MSFPGSANHNYLCNVMQNYHLHTLAGFLAVLVRASPDPRSRRLRRGYRLSAPRRAASIWLSPSLCVVRACYGASTILSSARAAWRLCCVGARASSPASRAARPPSSRGRGSAGRGFESG